MMLRKAIRKYGIAIPIMILKSRLFGKYSVPNIMPTLNAIFIHIPKNGGTSISRALGLKASRHWTAAEYKKIMGKPYNQFFKFTFVRHPWNRFLSNYWYAKMEYSYHHDDAANAKYGRHRDYELLKQASILDCANYLIAGKLNHGRQYFSLWSPHYHWSPQYHWLYDSSGKSIVDWVGKIETIDSDIVNLSRELGKEITLERLNQSLYPASSYWSDDDRKAYEIVKDYYKKDFELFGYDDIDLSISSQ